MNFKFDFEIDYQNDAINSVVNLFKGQSYTKDYINPKGQTSFKNKPSNDDEYLRKGISNHLIIDDDTILKNLQEVQKYNNLSESLTLDKKIFDIEMETGVGKTYVYLKTIFELNKKYGFTKFIIVVPSIAIKEGVYKTIEMTEKHFKGNYDDLTFNPFIYNPKKLNEINDFLYKPNIQIMIINIDSFNREFRDKTKESNIIHREQDRLKGYKPIEFIQQTNPIVIIDEPQSVLGANKSNKSYKAIPSLNPLFILRYSATHRQTQNLVYKLDAVDAHNLNLVKHIEVAGFESSNYCDGPYIKVKKIKHVNKKTKAEIEVDVINNSTTRRKITVTSGENLVEKTNNEIYDGYLIKEIVCDEYNNIKYVDFSSKEKLHEGESIGDVDNIKMKTAQIRQTIEKHLDKELRFNSQGIKVLSLFFIDKVANYRTYDENGNIIKGEYAKIFEKQYNILIKKDKYASLLNNDFIENPEKAHNGYFSIDSKGKNKGRFKDSKTGKSTDDGNTFNLIMKDKEKLLSLDNPLRFIFSHSALKEGWDNPNVFQICTLNESIETIKKRQEIGRGLRLCVNQDGERIKDPKTNILTIMANESYESFAKSLQSEFEEETGIKFGFLRKNSFVNIPFLNEKGDVKKLNEIGSEKLFNYLFENEYIKADGIIQDKLLNEIDNGTLLDDYTINIKDKVIEIINKHINKYKINNANKKCRVKVNDEIYNSESFIKFWELIKFKSTYSIKLDSSDFIKKCSLRISENLEIPDAKIIYTEYDLSIDSSGVNISENGVVRDLEIEYGKVKLPNILKYLQNNTPLTKRTIVKILKDSNTVNKFKKNPYEYQNRVCDIINSELNNQLIKGIEYFKLDSFYPRERFKNEEYEDYIDNLIPSECSIYNYINLDKLDSNVEREFAKSLEINDEVKMFTKLPFWFKISTPVGNYNPDWAILYEKDLHFIVETKGSVEYKDKYSSNRVNEDNKIACGRKHFETIAPNVKFIITNNYKNLVKNL